MKEVVGGVNLSRISKYCAVFQNSINSLTTTAVAATAPSNLEALHSNWV